MKKKIIITGGSGFLGSEITKILAKQKLNKVYIFDLQKNKNSKRMQKKFFL